MAHALLSRGAQGNHGGTGTEEAAAGLLPRVAGSVWCALALWLLVSNLFVPSYGFSRYETWAALLAGAAVLALMLGIPWLLDLTGPPAQIPVDPGHGIRSGLGGRVRSTDEIR